jgi:hypothetical protein
MDNRHTFIIEHIYICSEPTATKIKNKWKYKFVRLNNYFKGKLQIKYNDISPSGC